MKIVKRLCAVVMACAAAACIAVGASAAEKTPAEKAKEYTVDSPRFDLRDIGAVTSVKNQLPLDSCWAFAAISSIESNMIMQGMADDTIDLSERHLLWFTGGAEITDKNDPLYGDESRVLGTDAYSVGTPLYLAIGTLTRWSGVQTEAEAPYFVDRDMEPLSEEQRYSSIAHVEDVKMYEAGDVDRIQQALLTNGACYMSYYNSSKFFNEETSAYNSTLSFANHSVTIVGWDDNYSRENFVEVARPLRDGAWIVKNNWGTDWGEDGYFYISYEDRSLCDIASFVVAPVTNYGRIYQNDASVGVTVSEFFARMNRLVIQRDFTGASVFTAEKDESIAAAGFYTLDGDTDYTVTIYTDVKDVPTSGKAVHTQSGKLTNKGYHTIKLTKPVDVKKGTKFAVAVSFDGVKDIPLDGHSTSAGISYYCKGEVNADTQWTDTHDAKQASLCIKAYTEYVPPVAGNVELRKSEGKVTVRWDAVEGADAYRVYYRVGNKYKRTAVTKKTSASVKGLSDPESVGFVVLARVNGVWSEYSKKDLVYLTPDEPKYPLTLTAGNKKVTVKWDAVEGAESYRIYRYADGKYTTKTTSKTSYTFRKLTNGKEYGFLLRVKIDGKWSSYSKSDLEYITPKK